MALDDRQFTALEGEREIKLENPNENCLEGMRCPACKSYGPFRIHALGVLHVTDDGSEWVREDTGWSDNSTCSCVECDHTSVAKAFYEDLWEEGE